MKTARLILFVVIAAAVFRLNGQTFAQSSAADAVQQDLDAAKAGRTAAVNRAVSAMTAAFDAQIRSLTTGGDVDSAKILSTQKAAFVAGGTLPQSPLMSQAVTQYQLSIKDANDQVRTRLSQLLSHNGETVEIQWSTEQDKQGTLLPK